MQMYGDFEGFPPKIIGAYYFGLVKKMTPVYGTRITRIKSRGPGFFSRQFFSGALGIFFEEITRISQPLEISHPA